MSKSTSRSRARIGIFDIEATNLKADFGHVVCISAKIYGEKKITTFSTLQDRKPGKPWIYWDDTSVLKKWLKFASTCDCLVAHYGSRFDKPFLDARLIRAGLPPMDPSIPFIDTWRVSRFQLGISRNTLANLAEFLKIEEAKVQVSNDTWCAIRRGELKATREASRRCEQDVVVLEKCYEKLRPLIKAHPAMDENFPIFSTGRGRFFHEVCPKCSKSGGLISDGRRITSGGKVVKQRLRCNKCGSYSYYGRVNSNTTGIMGKP